MAVGNKTGNRFWWSHYDIDSTLPVDKSEGKWHEPQVIVGGAFPHSLWTHRIDAAKQSYYILRQIYSFPRTIIGWVRLPAQMLIGMCIKHSILALWGVIGWYTIIPATIMLMPLLISLVMVNIRQDMFLPSLTSAILMAMGSAL
jgi:hypothetical protein